MLVALCIVLDTLNQIPFLWNKRGTICTYYYIFNSLTFGGHYVPYCVPVLAAAAYSVSAYQEIETSICGYIVQRVGLFHYVIVKGAVSAVSSAIVCSGGMLIFTAWSMLFQPFYTHEFDDEAMQFPYYTSLSSGKGLKYLLIILLLLSMSGVMWSLIAMLCSIYFNNMYLTIACPLFFGYMFTRIMVFLRVPDCFRLDQMLHARAVLFSEKVTICFCIVLTIVISSISMYLFYNRLKKRLGDVI
jgi:hypothetical protein